MRMVRTLVAGVVVAAIVTAMLRCGGEAVTGTPGPRAAARMAEVMAAQRQVSPRPEAPPRHALATIAPGETWQQSFEFKLPIETFSLNGGSSFGRDVVYRDFELRVVENGWREQGVTARVVSARADRYDFDIWQLERDGKLLIPRTAGGCPDLEALGRLSRDEFLQVDWQQDPRRQGFDPEWDLRRGRGSAHRARITVAITAPTGGVPSDQRRGDIHFASRYPDIGLVLGLHRDPTSDEFVVTEGACNGGPLVCNPHRERFANAW